MKVLIIRSFPNVLQLDSYNVQEIGLAKALVYRGIECGVVLYHANQRDKAEEYRFIKNQKEYYFTIFWLRGYNILKNGFMPSLKKIIADYDVLQVNEYDQILSWKFYTKGDKPVLLYHGPYYDKYTKRYNLKCKVFDTFFLNRKKHNKVVVLTKSTLASQFLRKKGFSDVKTVGVGIDKDNFAGNRDTHIEVHVKKNSKKVRLLYVGKIENRRNVYFLVDVFENLSKKQNNIELIIVGDGKKKYVEKFKRRIEELIGEGKIIYIPKASQKELALIYEGADCFIFASNYEIFGMVLLEALYFGLPVISSMNGGASVLVKNGFNGYVMKAFEVEEWTRQIEYILNNQSLYLQMRKNAHETIKREFFWDELADNFIEGYQRAIDRFR